MSSKVLQKPQILSIQGSTIRIAHPNISQNYRTYLSSTIAAAGTTMTVQDTGAITGGGFADNDFMVVGEIGDQQTETNDVNGAVTRGTSMTVTNALSFAHELDAPVTKIFELGIQIFGASSDGGSGTLLESIDAKTASGRQLADATMISWQQLYTEYTLVAGADTAYDYYYVKFIDNAATTSDASDYVLAAGLGTDAVEYFIQQALKMTDSIADGKLIRREDLIKQANDCQTAIQQFKYKDPKSGEYRQMDWDFEVLEDKTSLTISTGEHKYALSGLTVAPKLENESSIISIRIGSEGKIDKKDLITYDDETEAYTRSDCKVTGAVTDTTLDVDSTTEFTASGTLYSGDNTLTYTSKTDSDTFAGIPSSGDHSIETEIAVDDPVWQGIQFGLPETWTYFNREFMFNIPPSSTYSGYPIKIRYFKKLTPLTETTDTTEIPFTNVFQYYLASWIERRKGNEDKAVLYMNEFNEKVLNNALSSLVPTSDHQDYYKFIDDI